MCSRTIQYVFYVILAQVFEHTLANTTGMDLHNVLWLKSRTSESMSSLFDVVYRVCVVTLAFQYGWSDG